MRLNRFLASCGLGSRRAMDKLIDEGSVTVNGEPVEGKAVFVEPSQDVVAVAGKVVQLAVEKGVFLLNKPVGYLTTMHDPQGRKTVKDLIASVGLRLFPVGRLDKDTEGLLLFTNDGDLCHRLAHPRYQVEKEYRVVVRGQVRDQEKKQLEQGVVLEEGTTSPAKVLRVRNSKGRASFHIVIHEGWKREVRRMCEAVGLYVAELERVRYAFLTLDGVAQGELRQLSSKEVTQLRKVTGL